MTIIGREEEIRTLENASESNSPEFAVVYGRMGVGKTFLINQLFGSRFAFAHSGLSPAEINTLKERNKNRTILELQLLHFYHSLVQYGYTGNKPPKNWLEAFHFLSLLLQEKKTSEKQIVFIDELPWLDTPKSFFLTAFESFCNGYASRESILLLAAGSAISWILRKLFSNHGGLYNRVTKQIPLVPFSLSECEKLLEGNHVDYSRYDIARLYMIFGGIPYYLNYIDGRYSLAENIDRLFFSRNGSLSDEYSRLFASSFDNEKITSSIVKALATKRIGLTRQELIKQLHVSDGEVLSDGLKALLVSGFIVKYTPLQSEGKGHYL